MAITAGEPAGIGPDLIIALAQHERQVDWVVLADADMLLARARLLGLPLKLSDQPTRAPGRLRVAPVALAATAEAGQLNPDNAAGVMTALAEAVDGCLAGRYRALVTGPMQKSVVNEAGIPFSGHTEFLRDRCDVQDVLMLLVAEGLRVGLATTHLPLAAVPAALTQERLQSKLQLMLSGLKNRFGLSKPRVLVTGLNPHAGESGHLGREEIDIIEPVCARFRARGAAVVGPVAADTAFTPRSIAHVDGVLAMYHDQGLPVLKYAGFGAAVNLTLGLPFVRASVDHGTALELAGKGCAETGSLVAALNLADALAAS